MPWIIYPGHGERFRPTNRIPDDVGQPGVIGTQAHQIDTVELNAAASERLFGGGGAEATAETPRTRRELARLLRINGSEIAGRPTRVTSGPRSSSAQVSSICVSHDDEGGGTLITPKRSDRRLAGSSIVKRGAR